MIGEFDLSTAEELREFLASLGHRVVLDMTLTTFIDSTTLNVLVAARNAGTAITIAAPPEGVRHVLKLTRFDELFTVRDSDLEPAPD